MGENVLVAARIRPFNSREKKANYKSIIETDSLNTVNVYPRGGGPNPVAFGFDAIFAEGSTQEQVYQRLGTVAVGNVLGGFNSTIFVYGQTGTGKTHTMMGTPDDMGLIPKCIQNLFKDLGAYEIKPSVEVSYVEVYQEKLKDLLNNGKELGTRILKTRVDVVGLAKVKTTTSEECLDLLRSGAAKREIHSTGMNAGSSRSHTVFTIHLSMSKGEDIVTSKLNLVDLAGRENERTTSVTGERMKELVFINKSLFFLTQSVRLLGNDSGKTGLSGFRDSKLTLLLADSLMGNSKTLVISTLSPSEDAFEEAITTCRFAEQAKKIKTSPLVNRRLKSTAGQELVLKKRLELYMAKINELEAAAIRENDTQNKLQKLEEELIRAKESEKKVEELEAQAVDHVETKQKLKDLEGYFKKLKAKRKKELSKARAKETEVLLGLERVDDLNAMATIVNAHQDMGGSMKMASINTVLPQVRRGSSLPPLPLTKGASVRGSVKRRASAKPIRLQQKGVFTEMAIDPALERAFQDSLSPVAAEVDPVVFELSNQYDTLTESLVVQYESVRNHVDDVASALIDKLTSLRAIHDQMRSSESYQSQGLDADVLNLNQTLEKLQSEIQNFEKSLVDHRQSVDQQEDQESTVSYATSYVDQLYAQNMEAWTWLAGKIEGLSAAFADGIFFEGEDDDFEVDHIVDSDEVWAVMDRLKDSSEMASPSVQVPI